MKQKKTIKKILNYVRKYWVLMILSMVFALITVALTLYVPILVGNVIDLIVGPGNVDFAGMKAVLEDAIWNKPAWHGDLDALHRSQAGRNMNQIGG